MKERIAISWSGGKDSCFALYTLLKDDKYIVDSLFTTIIKDDKRIISHGVRESLLEKQADSLGLPLKKMYIPVDCPNEIYQEQMDHMLGSLKKDGVTAVMFGDILLEDIRKYRESIVFKHDMKAVFPLWGENTNKLIKEFVTMGFETITTCIDREKLGSEFLGRVIDSNFLKELPAHVDPCGENGEFHTFCYDGPLFNSKVEFVLGEKINKGTFQFCDMK
ncbi:hypothetical protein A8F94_13165 [Bacillus sp. FJAT-27225]|uniref:Dph6-related ATP pyrophosphatase n=1 Tax=Bacillus sp. FJAT-27225 TaxID=1743144 RepID=UPI00080C2D18|nr:diphthine--ammonia ligase [Bacillus sp. FJAT-27225]OCA85816.1 hypothetical protein A8F94_13165 [Bacillus sp. FJAT-27225]